MLELLDLSRSFGAVRALDGLTMRAGTGRLHGFVGRNGAGKTTAMRIVLGLVAPDAGEVRWRGAPLTAEDRRRIGYMPEERGLYPQMGAAEQVA
jgi:ABC-2 type transport system ATP-binding protein